MSTDTTSDALGALSLSDVAETARPLAHTHDQTCDSDSNSSGSTETIRPHLTAMSKSKSADTLRSLVNPDDVFAPLRQSTADPDTNNAIARRTDQSIDRNNIYSNPHYAPRADRGTEITEYNAQGQLPPDAAIFCANLSKERTAEQLAESLHRAFDTFGKCYVAVRYDKHKNPYAVLQYESTESARSALRAGNRTMLDGRQVRLEQSKGDRAVIITLLTGGIVTEHEARELLSRFGEIETIMSTDMIPGRDPSEPHGQYVRFAYFLDCRDALRLLPEFSDVHRIQLAAGLEPKRLIGPAGSEIYTSLGPARNNTDSKSIYVGNLPEACTDNEVHIAFSRFGAVENINLVRKNYPGGALNCFAFVEFASPIDADTASQTEIWIKGNKLRIEPKEYTARRNQRMAFESPPSNVRGGPITPRRGFQSPPRQRIPFRISPAANAASQERLAQNNHHNSVVTGNYTSQASNTISPPRYNPYIAQQSPYAGYASGSPEAYQPHYTSPSHNSGLMWRHAGMMGVPHHVQELPQQAYADPAFMSAPYPPPPNYPYERRHPSDGQ